jgi:hypothetical protein
MFSFLSIALAILVASAAHATGTVPDTPPPAWNRNTMSFTAVGDYFTSHANYDQTRGSFTHLNNGNQFSNAEMRLRGRYAFTNQFMVFVGADSAQTREVDNSVEKINSEFTGATLGVDYALFRNWIRVVPEIEFIFPTDATDVHQTAPLSGDGVLAARAGTFLFRRYEHFRIESYLGFHFPDAGLSKKFMYSILAEVAFPHGFSLGGGIDGYETVLVDDSTFALRMNTINRSSAGSERFWSYNPSVMEAKFWLAYRPIRTFAVRLGFAQTINGVNTAQGQTYMLSLSFNTPGDKERATEAHDDAIPETKNFKTEPEKTEPEKAEDLNSAEKALERKRPN